MFKVRMREDSFAGWFQIIGLLFAAAGIFVPVGILFLSKPGSVSPAALAICAMIFLFCCFAAVALFGISHVGDLLFRLVQRTSSTAASQSRRDVPQARTTTPQAKPRAEEQETEQRAAEPPPKASAPQASTTESKPVPVSRSKKSAEPRHGVVPEPERPAVTEIPEPVPQAVAQAVKKTPAPAAERPAPETQSARPAAVPAPPSMVHAKVRTTTEAPPARATEPEPPRPAATPVVETQRELELAPPTGRQEQPSALPVTEVSSAEDILTPDTPAAPAKQSPATQGAKGRSEAESMFESIKTFIDMEMWHLAYQRAKELIRKHPESQEAFRLKKNLDTFRKKAEEMLVAW